MYMEMGDNTNSDAVTDAASGEPMNVGNSSVNELADFSSINNSVVAKEKQLNEVRENRIRMEKTLHDASEKLRLISELKRVSETEVAGLECHKEKAVLLLKQKQESLDESRKEVEQLQQKLKEERKKQSSQLCKYEDEMAILSKKFMEAPIINDSRTLENELKVLQAKSDVVRTELRLVKEELEKLTTQYGQMTSVEPPTEGTAANENNTNTFIKRIIKEMQAEVTVEKCECVAMTKHMKHLELMSASMRRELDNIKAKQ